MKTGIQKIETKYQVHLAGLASKKGQRNSLLLGIVNLGILTGLSDERILTDIREASGTPPLTEVEIKHAIRTARRDTRPLEPRKARLPSRTTPKTRSSLLGNGADSYVRRMIEAGKGSTSKTLLGLSPMQIPSNPAIQARLLLSSLYEESDFVFIGDQYDDGIIGENIFKAGDWLMPFLNKNSSPLLIANPLTGNQGITKEGKPSFRCGECVKAFRYALVEFDKMPLTNQCEFWIGVIRTQTLPLRSLVFSGSKSIHGLVQIEAKDKMNWDTQFTTLLEAVANSKVPESQRADTACKTPERLTRLPGRRNPKTGNYQQLLWLSHEPLGVNKPNQPSGQAQAETASIAPPDKPPVSEGQETALEAIFNPDDFERQGRHLVRKGGNYRNLIKALDEWDMEEE